MMMGGKIELRIIVFSLLLICASMLLLASGYANPDKGHLKLLAVNNAGGKLYGITADLYLEIKPGNGRVFIETLPASQLDTQMSTRLAESIACKYADVDCSSYDFFYTIKSPSATVGGPSASSSVVVLTYSLLKNMDLGQQTAITGTIGSGYLIGPVGGVKEKIDAGAKAGLKKIMIPKDVRFQNITEGGRNIRLDLVEYGKKLGISVIEVENLNQVLHEFNPSIALKNESSVQIEAEGEYEKTMGFLAEKLCARNNDLINNLKTALDDTAKVALAKKELEKGHGNSSAADRTGAPAKETGKYADYFISRFEYGKNLTQKGSDAYRKKDYYSSASYCFGANVVYKQLTYQIAVLKPKEVEELFKKIEANILKFNDLIKRKNIETITDLQTYMVVKERLMDANEILGETKSGYMEKIAQENNRSKNNAGQTDNAIGYEELTGNIAYASERLQSALAWSKFFGAGGKKFDLNEDEIRLSCMNKLSEATEFYNYVSITIPGIFLKDMQDTLAKAGILQQKGNYELCFFEAMLAKAQANAILSSLGIPPEKISEAIDRKINAAKMAITEEQKKGIFPILGYSYYEYARSIREGNRQDYSALLYAEYALELSNMDLYFKTKGFKLNLNKDMLVVFAVGILVGILLVEIAASVKRCREENRINDKANIKNNENAARKKINRKKKNSKGIFWGFIRRIRKLRFRKDKIKKIEVKKVKAKR